MRGSCWTVMALGAWLAAYGQPAQGNAQVPAAVQAPAVAMESEEETIGRCLRDLADADVAVRRRAALLIGKYSSAEAREALVRCLRDDDAQIRLGALVSLTEETALPSMARPEVFRMLADKDVQVRRMASSLLPEALGSRSFGRMVVVNGRVETLAPERSAKDDELHKEQREAMEAALADEDASVRRNVLSAWRMLDEALPAAVLRRFLRDASAEVRLTAVRLYVRCPAKERQAGDLQPLLHDASEGVRQELCRLCGTLGRDGVALLRSFLQDDVPSIRVQAVEELVQLQEPGSAELVQQTMLNEELTAEVRRPLLYAVQMLPDGGVDLCRQLLKGKSPLLAGEAMMLLVRSPEGSLTPSFFIPYIESDMPKVSEAALRGVRLRHVSLTAGDWKALMASKVTAARLFVLGQGMQVMPPELRTEILTDACLDEDLSIRRLALQLLARYRSGDWEELLIASLEDDAAEICETAAVELCRQPSPAARAAVQAFLEKCENEDLKRRLQLLLGRRSPVVRPPVRQGQTVTPRRLPPRPLPPRPMPPRPMPQRQVVPR